MFRYHIIFSLQYRCVITVCNIFTAFGYDTFVGMIVSSVILFVRYNTCLRTYICVSYVCYIYIWATVVMLCRSELQMVLLCMHFADHGWEMVFLKKFRFVFIILSLSWIWQCDSVIHALFYFSYNSFYFFASLNQPPQYGDSLKSLPSPLPMPLADDDSLATENEGDEGEDDEEVCKLTFFCIFFSMIIIVIFLQFLFFEMSPGFAL